MLQVERLAINFCMKKLTIECMDRNIQQSLLNPTIHSVLPPSADDLLRTCSLTYVHARTRPILYTLLGVAGYLLPGV